MKLKTFALFTINLLLLAAAKSPVTGKIKSIHLSHWRDTLSYQYDHAGRVSSASAAWGYITTYSYQGQTIIANTKGGSLVTMYLNSRGLVDSLTDVDTNRRTTVTHHQDGMQDDEMLSLGRTKTVPYTGNYTMDLDEIAGATTHGIELLSKKFLYDDQGFIREIRVYTKSGRPIISKHVVKDGNIVSYTVKYPKDTVHSVSPTTREIKEFVIEQLDFEVENTFDLSHTNTLVSNTLFGKSSKNIVTRSVRRSISPNSQDSTVTTFKYTFDAAGRVSALTTSVRSTDPPGHNQDKDMEDACTFTYY